MSWDEAFAEIDRRLTADRRPSTARDAVAVYLGNPNAHNLAAARRSGRSSRRCGRRTSTRPSTVDQMPKHVACGLVFGHPLAIPVPDLDRTDLL